jgi:RHS repeat-associated protein
MNRYSLYTPELNLMSETETSTASTPAVAYDYIWFGGKPVAQVDAATNTTHWTFTDHLGTPILQTNATGAIDWRAEYEPFGSVFTLRTGSTRHQPLRFPGQESDSVDGEREYNIFRWYRSGWGRFTQVDPKGLRRRELNLYSYVRGNPLRFIDPRGLTSYRGFSPDQESRMHEALNRAIKKLTEKPCCAGKAGPPILEYFAKAKFVFDPDSNECGYVNGFGFFSNTVNIGPLAFDPSSGCCSLESTLTHEVNHLRWKNNGEAESYKIEKDCFGCGTGKEP